MILTELSSLVSFGCHCNFGNDTWDQLCTLLKNRNIGFIGLKLSVVAVWIPVCESVKYLSIGINIDEMPAV